MEMAVTTSLPVVRLMVTNCVAATHAKRIDLTFEKTVITRYGKTLLLVQSQIMETKKSYLYLHLQFQIRGFKTFLISD